MPIAGGLELVVQVAHERGGIARLLERLREGDVLLGDLVPRGLVGEMIAGVLLHLPVGPEVPARIEDRPPGKGRQRFGVETLEDHAFGREAVEVRRVDPVVLVAADVVGTPGVGTYDDEIHAWISGMIMRLEAVR